MAVTATFKADFSSFSAAVEKAEVKLRSFEANSGRVEKSLGRMGDSLSGTKLIQDAALMAKAVEKVGGVSALTDRELQRLGDQAREATQKMERLGLGVPENLRAIAKAAESAEKPTGGLTTHMVALGAALGTFAGNLAANALITGGRAVVNVVGEIVTNGAKLSALDTAFDRLSASMGETADVMLGRMQQGTRGLVSDLDLMQSANKAVLLGLPVTSDQMQTLAQTAVTLGRAMGQDATTSLNDLITALGRSSPLILDNLGLTVKVGEANEAYAAKIGKTVEALSEAEKKQAFFDAAMDAARQKLDALGESQLTLGDRIKQASVWWENFRDDLSVAIARSAALSAGMDGLADLFAQTFGAAQKDQVAAIAGAVDDAALALVSLGKSGVTTAGFLIKEYYAVKKIFGDLAQIIDGNALAFKYASLAAAEFLSVGNNIGPFRKDVDRINGDIDMLLGRMAARGKALQSDDAAQQSVDASTEQYIASLDALQERMRREADAHTESAVVVATDAKAHRDAAAAVETHAVAVARAQRGFENIERQPFANFLNGLENVGIRTADIKTLSDTLTDEAKAAAEAEQAHGKLNDAIADIEQSGLPYVLDGLDQIGQKAKASFTEAEEHARSFNEFLSDELGPSIIRAIQGGGDIAGSIGGTVGDELGSKLGDSLAKPLTSALGSTIGGALGSIIPGLGTLLGAGVGKLIGGLFKDPEKQINPIREAFVQAAGGLDELNKRAHDAGVTLDAFLDAENPKAYQAAIDDLNAAFARQDALKDSASQFGPSKSDLDQMAKDTRATYDYMVESGQYTADQIALAFEASQEAQGRSLGLNVDALQDAATKAIDQMKAQLGALEQERDGIMNSLAGEAHEEHEGVIEQRQRARLSELTSQISAQQEQIDTASAEAGKILEDALADAAHNGTIELVRSLNDIEPVAIPAYWDIAPFPGPDGASTGGMVGPFGIQHFARGGFARGTDTVPAMLTPGEMVLTASQQRAIQSLVGSGGGGSMVIRIEAEGRTLAEIVTPFIPGAVKRYGLAA